jgi:hypothetical protein
MNIIRHGAVSAVDKEDDVMRKRRHRNILAKENF